MYEVGHVRCSADLTLIYTGVPVLRIFDLEAPVFGALVMYGSEPLVRGVSVPSHR